MTALIDLYNTDHAQLVSWVCRTHGISSEGSLQFQNPSRVRREAMARRLRLYRDQARVDVEATIRQIYETEDYIRTLHKYVPVALHQNVSRRIIDEVASLYDRPALRILTKNDEGFHAEEKRINLHEIMQEAHRLMALCNEVLLWMFKGADDKPKIRIVTPDMFDAIPHPKDQLVAAGYLIDAKQISVLDPAAHQRLPCMELWDDTYRYLINASGHMADEKGTIVAEPERHGLPRIPGVLLHAREPTTEILDASTGADITSAHLGVALLNVMILRLSKSQGERQPILSGNLANMASGQVMNGERPLLLPPEVTAAMLESKTDPDHYLSVKRDVIGSVGQTHGMSYEQFTFTETTDTSSGKAYQLRREKLTEIRMEKRRRAVKHEAQVVELMGFDPEAMRVDFQEQAIPQDASEKVALLKEKMKLGLDSPIAFLMREDPDLSREDAKKLLKENIRDYAGLIAWVRAINAPMGGDVEDAGKSPEENGRDGAEAKKQQPANPNEVATKNLPSQPNDDQPAATYAQ